MKLLPPSGLFTRDVRIQQLANQPYEASDFSSPPDVK